MPQCHVRLLLLAVTLGLAGCASEPVVPEGPDLLIDRTDALQLGYRYRWTRDLAVSPDRHISRAAILGDLIVTVEAPTNIVTALTLRDGEVRWMKKVATPLDILFEPVRNRGRIIINSETHLYSLAVENGQVFERTLLRSPVAHSPTLIDGTLVFGGRTGLLFTLDAIAGYDQWAHQLTGPVLARPLLSKGRIFVADSRGEYALLAAEDGQVLQSGRTFARISATPAVTRAGIFVASEDRTLYALNRATLKDRWKFRAPGPLTKSPVYLGGTVFLPVPRHGLIALDALSGHTVWQRPELGTRPVEVNADKVLLAGPNEFVVVALETGQTVTRVGTKPLAAALPHDNRIMVLVSRDGRVARLDRK